MRTLPWTPKDFGTVQFTCACIAVGGIFLWLDMFRRRKRALEGGRPCRKCVYRTALSVQECLDQLRKGGTSALLQWDIVEDGERLQISFRPAWRGIHARRRYLYDVKIEPGPRTAVCLALTGEHALSQSALDEYLAPALQARRG